MDWRASIENKGFAILPGLVPPTALNLLHEELARTALQRSRAGIRQALHLNSARTIANLSALAEVSRTVLGPGAVAYRATLFEKSPVANGLVVWHQDTALPLREKLEVPGWGPWSVKEGVIYAHATGKALSQALAVRVHLDESTIDNSPLRVLPGTHNLGVLSDDEIHELSTRNHPVDCIVSRGGVLAMRPLLVHASSKSRNDLPRRVLHIEYAASPGIADPLRLAMT
jgi:ectoine hydroxylase-related dioxygenase (phytanoyl-CoA dioxygenase family)